MSFLYPFCSLFGLDHDVMFADSDADLNILGFRDMRARFYLFLFLGHLVRVLSVIGDAGDRGVSLRRDFDQIESDGFCLC